jgi:hypothetical protein
MRLRALFLLAAAGAALPAAAKDVYFEDFTDGPGGWVANRFEPLPVFDGAAYCFGPWYLDSHHAPPGAGYLHMLMWLHTKQETLPAGLPNRFIDAKKSTDMTNAALSVRLRGEIDLQGAQLLLLAQGRTAKTTANFVLSGQPFRVTRDWSVQTVKLSPDPSQWTCMGARESMQRVYGCDDISLVLKDLNVDLIFVLFPLKVVPIGDVKEPHKLRAGQGFPNEPSYQVQEKYLPKGIVMFDWVKIDYP